MPMNIYTRPGEHVVFANPNAGYSPDIEKGREHLVVGQKYVIDRTKVQSSHTTVILVGFPDVFFNSVMFENC